tara:strand:+ start:599 stop:1255 length:657 start_codon:yes stop_codon:yes gene_type:complete
MHHIKFSEKEIKLLIETFDNSRNAVLSIENKLKSQCNYEKNICGLFMEDFYMLEAWYSQKYLGMGGYPLPNFNSGSTQVAFSHPEEVYKNFQEIEITELIKKNKFNKKQIYIKLSFEKFYVRKTLLGRKCAYRAGLVVEKIEYPKKNIEASDYDRTYASANEDTITLESIQKGYIVSDDFNNVLYDIKLAFLYALSEATQEKLFLIDEQSSINNLGSY